MRLCDYSLTHQARQKTPTESRETLKTTQISWCSWFSSFLWRKNKTSSFSRLYVNTNHSLEYTPVQLCIPAEQIFLANPLRVDFNLPEARNEEKRKRLRMSKL